MPIIIVQNKLCWHKGHIRFNKCNNLKNHRCCRLLQLKFGVMHLLHTYMLPYQFGFGEIKRKNSAFMALHVQIKKFDETYCV